jgi:hypothetical protein
MNKFLLVLGLLSFSILSKAQDIGIEKLTYPTKDYQSFELTSYFPIYYTIKNYGDDSIDNRVITLELIAEGASPRYTQFKAQLPKGWSAPVDDRKVEFYENGFHNLVGMSSVMGMLTPEYGAGDTLHICLVATVEGDVDRSNDSLCFYITLKERPNRDLVLHILSPEEDSEVHPNHTVSFDLSVRNDGEIAYDRDSVYGQMAIEKNQETLDLVNIALALENHIEPGDSATVNVSFHLPKSFETGQFFMGFRLAWLSDDNVFELGEGNLDNNIRYVSLNSTVSSVNDLFETPVSILNGNNALILKGDFSEVEILNTVLFNMNGQKVHSQMFTQPNGNSLIIPTNGLSNGAYMLLLEDGNGSLARYKVIVD